MQLDLVQVRQDKQSHDGSLRAFHGYVYQQLNSDRRDELLRLARERIALWKREQLCSSYYIRFWSSVVNAGSNDAFKTKVLDASDRRAVGMMQNSPFSFLMRELH